MKHPSPNTPSWLLACLATFLFVPQAGANCLLPHDPNQPSHWHWHIDTHVQFANLEGSDVYLSGDEYWLATHDLDGPLYGATITGSPPLLGNMFTGFFSYRAGDLDGDFTTRGLPPFPDGPYPGHVSFDRDEFELGVDVSILNAVYGRVAYSNYEMEGSWSYADGAIEPQRYEFDAWEVGVGFRQDYKSCFTPRLTFGVDAYLAILFFNHEHTEIDGGASLDSDGTGFKGRLEANAKYQVVDHTRIVLAGGYGYQDIDSDGLDLTDDGFFIRLGLEIAF